VLDAGWRLAMLSDRIMTPQHPRWSEFIMELGRIPICKGTNAHARHVLRSMDGIDVEASLQLLASMGGRCDCEIELDLGRVAEQVGS
jgi:hypothetical protein